jgi:hypothetical protein
MTFRDIVENTPDIATGYMLGLQAMGAHSIKINTRNPRNIGGSVNIDRNTKSKYPKDSRWDYAFDYNGEVFFVEVHPSETSDVNIILKKLEWLKGWLRNNAPLLEQKKAKSRTPYYWLQTGRFSIPPTSPQYRRIAQSGLTPINLLQL